MDTPLAFLKCLTVGMVLLLGTPVLNSQDVDTESVITDETLIVEEGSQKPVIIDITTITTVMGPLGPKTAEQRLEEIRSINAELLKRQEETLLRLERLRVEANQVRIFAKRS